LTSSTCITESLQQWGDAYRPRPDGPTVERRTRKNNGPVHVGFIDDRSREIAADDVATIRTSADPTDSRLTIVRRSSWWHPLKPPRINGGARPIGVMRWER
jgi:hypothetical protein